MAFYHKSDSILEVRDQESLYSKDRIKIIPADEEPPVGETDITRNCLFLHVVEEDEDGNPKRIRFTDGHGNVYGTFCDAAQLGGKDPSYYASAENLATESAKTDVFTAVFLADGWTSSTDDNEVPIKTQTVTCTGMKATYDIDMPRYLPTGVVATDETLYDALELLCEPGNEGVTLEGQLQWICRGDTPECDIQVYFRRMDKPTEGGA